MKEGLNDVCLATRIGAFSGLPLIQMQVFSARLTASVGFAMLIGSDMSSILEELANQF